MPEKQEPPHWYPWHWSSFLASTRWWPFVAKAVYRELLDIQWQEGSIPAKVEKVRMLVPGVSDADWETAWLFCEEKFPLVNQFYRQNWVQAGERQKAVTLMAIKRAAGSLGGKSKKNNASASSSLARAKHDPSHLHLHLQNTVTPKSKDTVRRLEAPPADADWLAEFKLRYPHRAGDANWRGAQRAASARLREGHTVAEFLEGAERYARYIRHLGKERTEFVKQAATFLGPSKAFLELWELPANKAEARTASNIDASKSWLAKQREKANGPE